MIGRKILGQLFFTCILAVISAGGLAADAKDAIPGGSCASPVEEPQKAVVSTPDYISDSDTTHDPETDAAQAAWHDYQVSVFDGLSGSPDPRDWAVAALTDVFQFDQSSQDRHAALLRRATRAAPDDLLVQWIASLSHSDDAGAAASQVLQRIEPDNAAVWLKGLNTAILRKDKFAADAALRKMSISTRFDLHYPELMKALTTAYQRYPLPESYTALMPRQEWQSSERVFPFINAVAITAAVAYPGFQFLLQACRVNQATGENATRAGDCATIGRLMTTHSDSVLVNRLGSALLRVSHTFSDDDAQIARNQNWIYAQYVSSSTDWLGQESADKIITYQEDWVETGDELEAMRRTIARAGIPAIPPDDWVDTQSPFSAERLRDDEARLLKDASAH